MSEREQTTLPWISNEGNREKHIERLRNANLGNRRGHISEMMRAVMPAIFI